MSVIDLLINIINPETEIKTEIETEIKTIWKLTIETETEKYFKTEIQYKRKKPVTHTCKTVIETKLIFETEISLVPVPTYCAAVRPDLCNPWAQNRHTVYSCRGEHSHQFLVL